MSAAPFPGSTVTASFRGAEQALHEVLEVVPYCKDHERVWSPQLATILLNACSQLDSLWKSELAYAGSPIKKPDINDYFRSIGGKVAGRWLVLWGDEGTRLQPFAAWQGVADYATAAPIQLPWWKAHTDVKHNRLANRKDATLQNTALAVAGLFIAIAHCPYCADHVAQEGWIPQPDKYFLGGDGASRMLKDDCPVRGVVAESRLFSHPVHVGGGHRAMGGPVVRCSYRFSRWCDDNGVRID